MNQLAVQQAPKTAKQKAHTPKPIATSSVVSFLNIHARETPYLQRKSTCACGGGCPRCKPGNGILQPKLKIGAPNDHFEIEADRVADQVMRMQAPGVQRKPT